VVRGEKNRQSKKAATNYYILNDAPALSGTELTNVKQDFNAAGRQRRADRHLQLHRQGALAWHKVTRKIAQRGQEQQAPGQSPQQSFQHFAAVLDGELVTVPYIDYQQNPDGIDGANGADIEGGFTIQSAQDLAKLLQIGALPIKLKLISQSQVSATLGKEALSQGVTAGLVGLGLVALFLLVFYRVLA